MEKQMTFADFAPTRSAASVSISSIAGPLQRWFAARRAARQQHLALQSLLFMPEHRLRDLGIGRDELIRVMEIHRK
jgi:uncharacterized protein YjiS (DUF1127 family)